MSSGISGRRARTSWTFLTNHGHVLVCMAQDPGVRGRDIAERVGITERAAQAIISDLVSAGYVQRSRIGRRNHYEINPELPVRHPLEQPNSIGDLLRGVAGYSAAGRAPGPLAVGLRAAPPAAGRPMRSDRTERASSMPAAAGSPGAPDCPGLALTGPAEGSRAAGSLAAAAAPDGSSPSG